MTVLFALVLNALLLNTVDFGVALEIGRTRALGLMIDAFAQGVEATRSLQRTGITTSSINTGLIEWTVDVRPTANHTAIRYTDFLRATIVVDIAFLLFDLT